MPAGGRTIAVPSGANLQAALNAAVPGDVLVLDAGATYTGNFTLPKKTGTGWIVIRSNGTLPPEGVRVQPGDAAQMAKVVGIYTEAAFIAQDGAGYYRLEGLEITHPNVNRSDGYYRLLKFGSGAETSLGAHAHHIIVDRSYIHGWPGIDLFTCIELNSASTAIIDSWVSDCHSNISADGGYAIKGWNGPGPFKIVNNYLAGSGSNVFFGGADPSIAGLVPSDIEIRRNYMHKPAAWKGVWRVKNILESKNSQRVLVEGNVLDGSWVDGQDGVAINLKSANQSGACTWCVTQDWTLRYNKVRNAGYGAVVSANPTSNMPAVLAKRITFYNNVFDRLSQGVYTGGSTAVGLFLYFGGAVDDLVADHNTVVVTGSPINGSIKWAYRGPFSRFAFTNNIVVRGAGGVFGCSSDPSGCGGEGSAALNTYAPSGLFAGNAVIGANASIYPAGNLFPASIAATGFTDPATFNWRLTAGSPAKGTATDGGDPGADIAGLEAATQGVAAN
jgi:hypothetical protein